MELNFEGVIVGAAALLVIGAFHPLVIWCEVSFYSEDLAGIPDYRSALHAGSAPASGAFLHSSGAFERRLPVEHP